MRERFVAVAGALLDEDVRAMVVLADISAAAFQPTAVRHPGRVINVGIREQLALSVSGGLALTGLRPIVHSYAPFLVDRAYEQIKLDVNHQGVGAVLVSVGASYDGSTMGRTHMSPMDVPLIDTLPDWTVHVPGHADEVEPLLRTAMRHDRPVYLRLSTAHNDTPNINAGGLAVVRRSRPGAPLVVAVGPMLRPTLAAVADLDVCVAYTHTPRPLDAEGLRELAGTDVILVEPYLAGTSSHEVGQALAHRPHRLLALGVRRNDLHRYGTPSDHARWHGLDAPGLRHSITAFLAAA